ncbi:endoplasmic reticulum metallopeptidase 1 isoform X2 [Agrilus planipennis]|uniref:FXNA-like protease n=1 Tax=Agrilus planipennis TaxID=224129 RepID=A0A7F5R548_AGRPL|nr:endoplasmic reticulum metallopeptidase 1 isoform X2 [Agrilus planipennis]XP_025831143.1 endoplasmic reticulum metallopeptidase 1 isoform X2 [Agrilus planipennis]
MKGPVLRRRPTSSYSKGVFVDPLLPKTNRDQSKILKPIQTFQFFGLLGLIVLVFIATVIIEKRLPVGLKVADQEKYPDQFIAERAFKTIKSLSSLGPRIAGSEENEVKALNILKKEINEIISHKKDHVIIETDVQRTSGGFYLEFLDGMTNVYSNLQNLIVKVGSHIKSSHSLLINCHFDSVTDSPGASDDGAGCALMMEILRVISQSNKTLKHNIIFLFNGAEENFMPASHGFITQHKWAKEIRAVINIEACGAGGREVLFQAGPNHPWILETYAEEVPYPYASSLAQEIFQTGVIPGDSDFRIFRDFGNISGLDFAWTVNGYVYHTKFDNIDQIPLGSIQRTGDNILALARGMAQGHQIADIEQNKAGNLIFFDFLGAFVVRWPEYIASFVNILTVIFSIYTMYQNASFYSNKKDLDKKAYIRKLLRCSFFIILSWIGIVIIGLTIALILNLLGRTMSWYARPVWLYFLYVIPTALGGLVFVYLHAKTYNKDVTSLWALYQLYYDGFHFIWTIVLTVSVILKIRSGFVALLWSLFPAVGSFMKVTFFRNLKDDKYLLYHIGIMGLPFTQSVYLLLGAMYLFVPIMGRAGAANNSEMIIAFLVCFLFGLLFSYLSPLILLVRNPQRIFSVLSGLVLLAFAVLILTPLGFPYSGEPGSLAPQRFMIAHAKRTYHDESGKITNQKTGFWIVNMDINSPHSVDRYVPEMKDATSLDQDCIDYLYCGVPYLVPVQTFLWKTHWIPSIEPYLTEEAKLNIVKHESIDEGKRITVNITGPHHIGVMISPKLGVELTKWSLVKGPPLAGPLWNGRATYFIYYSYGVAYAPLEFSMDFKVPENHEGPVMDIAVTAHYQFGPAKAGKTFEKFVKQFPVWTTINYWTATYESWVI